MNNLPHSRACGIIRHEHGVACSRNCPTCEGREFVEPTPPIAVPKNMNELANELLSFSENFAPILDAADGMRADLERRGWSPTMAEQLAGTWLQGMMMNAFGIAKP